jgi:hypothetical protein
MRVIAFYTKDTEYEKLVPAWEESFKSCKTKIYPIENLGSWEENCAMKPKVLLEALLEFDDHLLYVDIDAELCRPLPFIPVPNVPGFSFLDKFKPKPFNRQLASGTIYLPQTVPTYKIVLEWLHFQQANPKMWDQMSLQHIVENMMHSYQVLPPEWCGISIHQELEDPIIYHNQASRRLKKTL